MGTKVQCVEAWRASSLEWTIVGGGKRVVHGGSRHCRAVLVMRYFSWWWWRAAASGLFDTPAKPCSRPRNGGAAANQRREIRPAGGIAEASLASPGSAASPLSSRRCALNQGFCCALS